MKNKELKDYKKSANLWIESQVINISLLNLQMENAKKNIILNRESLKNTKKSLLHEQKVLDEFIKAQTK
jgi:hypothetical protein